MTVDFFDRLGADLAQLTRQGAHLAQPERTRRRRGRLFRRSVVSALLVVVLALSLVSEFPASARGHARAARPALTATL